MAKIWTWAVSARTDRDAHVEYVRTATFEPGLNLFAQVHITRFVVSPTATSNSSVQPFIHSYAVWNADGSQSPPSSPDAEAVAFIRNCAWVQMGLGVVAAFASAQLTLIEWT